VLTLLKVCLRCSKPRGIRGRAPRDKTGEQATFYYMGSALLQQVRNKREREFCGLLSPVLQALMLRVRSAEKLHAGLESRLWSRPGLQFASCADTGNR
jgi:hypothetical protein